MSAVSRPDNDLGWTWRTEMGWHVFPIDFGEMTTPLQPVASNTLAIVFRPDRMEYPTRLAHVGDGGTSPDSCALCIRRRAANQPFIASITSTPLTNKRLVEWRFCRVNTQVIPFTWPRRDDLPIAIQAVFLKKSHRIARRMVAADCQVGGTFADA